MSNYKHILVAIFAISITACTTTKTKTETQTQAVDEPAKTTKLEKLVYGKEMPLVCSEEIPAIGILAKRPNLQLMWENYLYGPPAGVWREIGGLVEVNGNLPYDQGQWTNACTVRLSHMLNKSGHPVPRVRKKTVSGKNKGQHFYRVVDMEDYLEETYGKPDVAIEDGTGNSFDLPVTPGIVLMDFPNSSFTGHVTVWNGSGTVDGTDIGGYRVLFWNLPCFIPAGRENTPVAGSLPSAQTLLP